MAVTTMYGESRRSNWYQRQYRCLYFRSKEDNVVSDQMYFAIAARLPPLAALRTAAFEAMKLLSLQKQKSGARMLAPERDAMFQETLDAGNEWEAVTLAV
jgi:hypothetical protein